MQTPELHLHCNRNVQPLYYHAGVAVVVYIPKEQWRVTGVCVQYKPHSACASLGTPEPQTGGQVQTPLKEKRRSHHLEECTGADTRQ